MASTSYSEFRKHLKYFMDKVSDESGHLLITRQGKAENAVLVSESEWDSLQETLHIMSDPLIMEGIRAAQEDIKEGRVTEYASFEAFKKAMHS